jgi:gas vesicle protein
MDMDAKDSLWEKVRKNLVEWYDAAYEKTDELARIGKKKVEMLGINRAIEKHLSELGGRVYDLIEVKNYQRGIAQDEAVLALIKEIRQLEEQLKSKEEDIERIKGEKKTKREMPTDS